MDWDEEEDLPPETPEEIYQNLRRSLQRQMGFELHFVVGDRNKDEELFDRLRREIPEKRFAQLVLDRKATTLLNQVQALAETTAFDVLFVRDLDEALLDYEDTKRQAGWSDVQIYSVDWRGVPPILQHLNWARETLRDQFPCAFVVCCRPTTIQYLSERAPDFFDWRLGVYRFPLKPSEIDQKILEESLAEDSYEKLIESERIRKLLELTDLIKITSDNRQLSQLYLQAGKVNLHNYNYGPAIVNFVRALDFDPTNASAAFFQGNALLYLKRYEEAIAAYQWAIELDPNYVYAHNNLGNAYRVLKRYEEAIAAYQRAIELDPNYVYAHNNLGNAYYDLKRYEEAIAAYQRAIELDPNYVYAHNGLGNAYRDLKRYEEAIAAFQRAIELDPNYVYAHNGLGNAYRDLKRYEEAIAAFQRAIELEPNEAIYHNNLGLAYGDLKRYEEAIAAYQRAIELDPNYASPHNRLGNAYYDLKRYEEAIAAYQRAIELDPNYAYAHNGLGNAYYDLKRYEEAIAAYQRAIELDPSYSWSYQRLGWLFLQQKNLELAELPLLKAAEFGANEYAHYFNLGTLRALQERLDEARDWWQNGLALCTGDSEYDRLGYLIFEMAIGEGSAQLATLKTLLIDNPPTTKNLESILEDLDLLAECPELPAAATARTLIQSHLTL